MLPRMRQLSFRPRWWAFALAAAACAAGTMLGNWQLGRAEERRMLAARIEAAERGPALELAARPVAREAYVQRKVAARGEFLAAYTILLDNKVHRGRAGYHVVQPLLLAGGDGLSVLVNRGWIAAPARREDLPVPSTPSGELRIEGLALAHLPRAFAPAGVVPNGRVWQNLALEDFAAWSGLPLQPLVIEQRSALDDGLVRDWPKHAPAFQRNEMYALQWYSLAALAVVLFVVLSFRKDPHAAG